MIARYDARPNATGLCSGKVDDAASSQETCLIRTQYVPSEGKAWATVQLC
jgi:hypothetical protein